MSKPFSPEEIETAAQYMARLRGIPIEVARMEAHRKAAEIETERMVAETVNTCPLILKEIAPSNSVPQYWAYGSAAVN